MGKKNDINVDVNASRKIEVHSEQIEEDERVEIVDSEE